jgi:hypothetical protein
MQLLVAVRMGMWPPQLARQLADGRIVVKARAHRWRSPLGLAARTQGEAGLPLRSPIVHKKLTGWPIIKLDMTASQTGPGT